MHRAVLLSLIFGAVLFGQEPVTKTDREPAEPTPEKSGDDAPTQPKELLHDLRIAALLGQRHAAAASNSVRKAYQEMVETQNGLTWLSLNLDLSRKINLLDEVERKARAYCKKIGMSYRSNDAQCEALTTEDSEQ